LAASIVGLRIEWIDGVHGADITPKALPEVCALMASKRGCAKEAWRGRELASSHERTCEVSEESLLGAVGTALI
jgi:hypothetical protein